MLEWQKTQSLNEVNDGDDDFKKRKQNEKYIYYEKSTSLTKLL